MAPLLCRLRSRIHYFDKLTPSCSSPLLQHPLRRLPVVHIRTPQPLNQLLIRLLGKVELRSSWRLLVPQAVKPPLLAFDSGGVGVGVLIAVVAVVPIEDVQAPIRADRYHCYQDANADPAGIEREKGRLYRLRYKETPRAPKFDLAKETDEQLIERLGSPNVYFRETAQRVLQERGGESWQQLLELVKSQETPVQKRRHALFSLIGAMAQELPREKGSYGYVDPTLDIWHHARWRLSQPDSIAPLSLDKDLDCLLYPEKCDQKITSWMRDEHPRSLLAHCTSMSRLKYHPVQIASWLTTIQFHDKDLLIPQVAWQNIHPLLEDHTDDFLLILEKGKFLRHSSIARLMPRFASRILARKQFNADEIAKLLTLLVEQDNDDCREAARSLLYAIAASSQTGGFDAPKREALNAALAPTFSAISTAGEQHALYVPATQLSATWGDAKAIAAVEKMLAETQDEPHKIGCLKALIGGAAPSALSIAERLLDTTSVGTQEQVIYLLGRMNSPQIAEVILSRYAKFDPGLHPKALELLTTRVEWSTPLLAAIEAKTLTKDALNLNQLRRMASFKDEAFAKQFKTLYGTIREGRNPDREHVINQTRDFLKGTPGDAERGIAVYKKVCAQCHKMYSEGAEVGPDITLSGRNNWDQLLTNVLDPSLVIGGAYQARILQTTDGRVLTGLPVEETDQRVVLKVQGGKLETIPRDQIEVYKVSEVSMMPEQLEKQLTPQELADLFSYLALDKPPSDPQAKYLPGYPRGK